MTIGLLSYGFAVGLYVGLIIIHLTSNAKNNNDEKLLDKSGKELLRNFLKQQQKPAISLNCVREQAWSTGYRQGRAKYRRHLRQANKGAETNIKIVSQLLDELSIAKKEIMKLRRIKK